MAEWIKLYTALRDHPKWVELDLAVKGLWTEGALYVGKNETAGFVPAAIVRKEAGRRATSLSAALVENGLWEAAPDGFVMHDWGKAQEALERIRVAARDRQKRHRGKVTQGSRVTLPASRSQEQDSDQDSELSGIPPEGAKPSLPAKAGGDATLQRVVDVWNDNRGALPALAGVPVGDTKTRQGLRKVAKHFAGDEARMGLVFRRVAGNKGYVAGGYGFLNLVGKLEKWEAAALAAPVEREVQSAKPQPAVLRGLDRIEAQRRKSGLTGPLGITGGPG